MRRFRNSRDEVASLSRALGSDWIERLGASGYLGRGRLLNVGCGERKLQNAVNVDLAPETGPDVVASLELGRLPFAGESFAAIVCQDVIEHVTDIGACMRELHRITEPGGSILIRVPHFSSRNVWVDPTHRHAFSVSTFDFFSMQDGRGGRSYYFDFAFAEVRSVFIEFRRSRYLPWNPAAERLINLGRAGVAYEHTALAALLPCANVCFHLIR